MEKKNQQNNKDKSRIRVFFPFVGKTIGGSNISTLELYRGLNKDEFEPIFGVQEEGMFSEYLRQEKIPYLVYPSKKRKCLLINIIYIVYFYLKTILFLYKNKIQIVHSNDGRDHHVWELCSMIIGVPCIRHQRSKYNKYRYESKILRFFPHTPEKIITISQYCKESLPNEMKSRTQVVMNPFDVVTSSPNRLYAREKLIEELGCSNNVKIVAFIANISERKRPDVFIKMADIICNSYPRNIIFPMFGDKREPMISIIVKLIKEKKLEQKCVIMGPRIPIEPWLSACDIMVTPSVMEPFGRTLVESMIVGTPIIASDMGGHKEIIQHNLTGILVTPDDALAFADATTKLLDNHPLQELIVNNAKNWAISNCSTEKHVNAIQNIYRDIYYRKV